MKDSTLKDKVMNGFLKFAEVLQSQKHLSAVKFSFASLLPVIISGAFCTLIMNVVCSTTTTGMSLAKINGFAWLEKLTPMFASANYATMNFMTIGIVILIALNLGKHYKHTEFVVAIVALASYISLSSSFTTIDVGGVATVVKDVLPRQFTNAQGLFMGIFTALISTELYVKIVDSGKFVIKMPDSVPENIAKSFSVLIPSIMVILIVSGFGMIFEMIFKVTVFDAISVIIQKPLTNVLTGLPGYLIVFFLVSVLWVFGIHGGQVLKPVFEPILLAAILQNTDAVTAGLPPVNILNTPFNSCFFASTGTGLTGGLIIAILLFSKRKDNKTIAKLSLPLAIFNINEPVIFGLPIVLNPIYAIPFMLAPLLSGTFAYFMTKIGFAGIMTYVVPWTTPPLLKSFLASGGNIGTVITEALCIAISCAVYTPFVLIANRMKEDTVEEI